MVGFLGYAQYVAVLLIGFHCIFVGIFDNDTTGEARRLRQTMEDLDQEERELDMKLRVDLFLHFFLETNFYPLHQQDTISGIKHWVTC